MTDCKHTTSDVCDCKPAQEIKNQLDDTNACMAMIRDFLSDAGADMTHVPPMMYPEAIRSIWRDKTKREVQRQCQTNAARIAKLERENENLRKLRTETLERYLTGEQKRIVDALKAELAAERQARVAAEQKCNREHENAEWNARLWKEQKERADRAEAALTKLHDDINVIHRGISLESGK